MKISKKKGFALFATISSLGLMTCVGLALKLRRKSEEAGGTTKNEEEGNCSNWD